MRHRSRDVIRYSEPTAAPGGSEPTERNCEISDVFGLPIGGVCGLLLWFAGSRPSLVKAKAPYCGREHNGEDDDPRKNEDNPDREVLAEAPQRDQGTPPCLIDAA